MTARGRAQRWILIGAGVLLALVVVVAVLVPLLVPVDHFRPFIVRLAEENTGRKVEIDALRLHVLPTIHVQVVNLHVKNPAGFPDGDTLVVKSLDVGTTLSNVLARRVDVTRVGFNGVEANLLETPGGKTNYDFSRRLGKPAAAHAARAANGQGFSITRIGSVTARAVKITSGTYDPATRKVVPLFAVDGVNALMRGINLAAPNWPDSVEVIGDLGGILFSNPALTKPLRVQKGIFRVKNGAAHGAFTASLETLQVVGTVNVANIRNPIADFEVIFPELDVDKLEALARATAGGRPPAPPSGPRRLLARGDIKIGKVIARPVEAGNVNARLTLYTDKAEISPYSLAAFGGTVRGSAVVDYGAPRQPVEINAQARGMDVAAVLKAVGRPQQGIAGKLDADARATTALVHDPLTALKVTVDSYTLAAFGGVIRGTATVDYQAPGQPAGATAVARGVDIAAVLKAAGRPQQGIAGKLDADVRATTALLHDPLAALKVTVDSYTLAAFGGVIRGTAMVDYQAPGQPARATAVARGVSLRKAMAALDPSAHPEIGGTADVDAQLATQLRRDPLAALTTTGSFALRDGILPGLSKPVQVQRGTFSVSPGSARGTFTALVGTVAAQGAVAVTNLKNPFADFDVTVPALDVDQVKTLFGGGAHPVGKGTPAPGAQRGARRQLAKGVLRIGRLRARPVEASALTTAMIISTDSVTIPSYTMSVYGGTVRGAANVDYAAPHMPMQTTVQASGVDFRRVVAALSPGSKRTIGGTLEGAGNLSTALAEDPLAGLTGTGTFALRNGTIQGLDVKNTLVTVARVAQFVSGDFTKFSYFGGDFRIQHQRVYSNALKLDSDELQATGQGSSGFNQTLDYTGIADVQTTVFSQPQTQLGLVLLRNALGGKVPVPQSVRDFKARVPFAIKGTFDNPKFSTTGAPEVTPLGGPAKPQPQQPQPTPPQVPGIPQLPFKLPPLPFPLGP